MCGRERSRHWQGPAGPCEDRIVSMPSPAAITSVPCRTGRMTEEIAHCPPRCVDWRLPPLGAEPAKCDVRP